MILTFEEGEVEYDKEMLEKTNSFVINIEKQKILQKNLSEHVREIIIQIVL